MRWRWLWVLGLLVAGIAQAQDYPNRTLRLITPAAQGGTTDLLAPLFGARLSEIFKQQVIVDNRASASGVIGGDMTAKERRDRKSTRLNSSHTVISSAVICLKKKKKMGQ